MFFRKKKSLNSMEKKYLELPLCDCKACSALRNELGKKIGKRRVNVLDSILEEKRFK